MNGYDTYEEHQPVTWIRGHPIYAAHFVVLLFVASMVFTTAFLFAKASGTLGLLTFDSSYVLHGEIWRIFTYGLVNDPRYWLSFALSMLVIGTLGRDLEKFFGRKKFLCFFGVAYLLKPLLFTLCGLWSHSGFSGQPGGFAVLVAFATLYPNAMFMFNLLAKWVAIAFIGIGVLVALSQRDTTELIGVLATSAFAFAFVRYQQGRLTLPSFRLPRRQPKFQVLPGGAPSPKTAPQKTTASSRPARDITTSEMDALLDKIARSGMGSLTAEERARLDAAAKAHTQRRHGR